MKRILFTSIFCILFLAGISLFFFSVSLGKADAMKLLNPTGASGFTFSESDYLLYHAFSILKYLCMATVISVVSGFGCVLSVLKTK